MPRRRPLCKLLEEHNSTDNTELAFRDEMLNLLKSSSDPFSRDHFEPGHFTASAFLLSPERDALLLILHGKLHRWLQPGGHIDPCDEHALAGALRELREETGIQGVTPVAKGLFDVDIHDIPARKHEPAHKHFDLRFAFVAKSRVMQASSDALDARWVDLDAIHTVESDESVMRAVTKLISMTKEESSWTRTTSQAISPDLGKSRKAHRS